MRRKANGGKRFLAFLIDVIPIWLISLVAYQNFTGESPFGNGIWVEMTPGRLLVRDGWLLWWILYGSITECTPLRGTFGKKVMQIEALGPHHRRPSFLRALGRNSAKILSAIPCYFGFLWIMFSKDSNTWHDALSKCGVFERR